MELGIEAARWVVSKALGSASGGVLEAWAASSELGPNIRELRMELLYAQGMLNNARGRGRDREIQNPALTELLQELRGLAYRADDVLDELDYFRIQDELDGTYHAAEEHAGGCLRNHALNARHTTRAIAKVLGFSNCTRSARPCHEPEDEDTAGVRCGAWPCLGPRSPDEDQEEDAGRQVLCGAVWPCGRASSLPLPPSLPPSPPPPTNPGDLEADGGCLGSLASSARDTIHAVGKHLPCCSASSIKNDANSNLTSSGHRFLCCAVPNKVQQRERVPQKLKFDRVEMSRTMREIVEQLKPVCVKVSTILNLELLDSNRSIAQCIAANLNERFSNKQQHMTMPNGMSQRITTSEFKEPKFYGRAEQRKKIICGITKGEYFDKDVAVLPIVGPGGIGKTTLTQYIYNSKVLRKHFEVKLWVCVSVNFSVHSLTQEIAAILPKDTQSNGNKDSPEKQIEERLKSKRFLLVLDDMWNCGDKDEWQRFLVPFKKETEKGSLILVTTRFPALAQMVKTTDHWIDLQGLDHEAFEALFLACVFDDKESINDHRGLLRTGNMIVEKLKGSPLAAKTVGRLLRNHLHLDHWNKVLESKEWESREGDHDIMPALKLSFDYLPFHLQQCFTYCALFPEDYKFRGEELIHFWIGLDVLHSHGGNKRIEEIGQSYLTELVNHGFFKREEDKNGETVYIIHDLLHELALKCSAQECLSIYSSNVSSLQIPPSIRHLSINIEDSCIKDSMTFGDCQKEFRLLLEERLKVENLHTLMLFGEHLNSFAKTFGQLFSKVKSLRVIFISGENCRVEDLFHNFVKLVHLRYLRICGSGSYWKSQQPPKHISRFYHMRVLDLRGCKDCYDLPRYVSNLVKLRHFLVKDNIMHSSIFGVGRLKLLQELRRFVVKKECKGFDLGQIGHLQALGGSLHIDNIEKVEGREEADGAKLTQKKNLHMLTLNWDINPDTKDPRNEEQVLEGLKPSSNLQKLCIIGHGGATCPSWLGANLSVENLESLSLTSVAWKNFPPIGELWLGNEHGEELSGNICNQNFQHLGWIELGNVAGLKRWIVDSTLFHHLKGLIIKDCPELVELSFTHSTCSQQEQQSGFPSIQELVIEGCPKLVTLPLVPCARSMRFIRIKGVGLGFQELMYEEDFSLSKQANKSALCLEIRGKDDQDSACWTALDFQNLNNARRLIMDRCPPLPLDRLHMLQSLEILKIRDSSNAFGPVEYGCGVPFQFPVKRICISNLGVSGKELTQVLSYMTKLTELEMWNCEKITGLGVVAQHQNAQSSSNEVEAQIGQYRREEIAEIEVEGLLLLPPQLEVLEIIGCPELHLRANSLDGDEEAGLTRQAGGLQGLRSLRSLWIDRCPKFLSSYLSLPSSCFPFPNTLQNLRLYDIDMLAPLSNLTSLTVLIIYGCKDLRGEHLWRVLTHGCLTTLHVIDSLVQFQLEEGVSFRSSKLQSLLTSDVAPFLVAPFCSLLASSLTKLDFGMKEERFSEEQEQALRLLTSLHELEFFSCDKLQSLPAGLHTLRNLNSLRILFCPAIRSLPKNGLPNSLQKLTIFSCKGIRTLPKESLPNSLQSLEIEYCPAIRSLSLPKSLQELTINWCPAIRELPKQGLPSSLRLLNVRYGSSEQLTRQCRKLVGTIPIVYLPN
ncbi:hypothetical protein ACP70R_019029 [Stipagrostis hirtigluma subsp. patula]